MGSGSGGNYSGGGGGSQPYAPTYHVTKDMMDRDKQDVNIYNPKIGYYKNPLASSIQDAIVGDQVYMNGRSADGKFTYVLNNNGNVVFAKRYNPNNSNSRAPHPTLIGGKNPSVQCAGMIELRKGRIVSFNNDSGHFRPNSKSLEKVSTAMEKLRKEHPYIFSKKYSGGKK